ncbi:histone acetyltransferase [Micromonas commoda]|uniref:histone acetyltransferase n=1 Tax=Micromonas commoda (strain RCC299 / NOUM17 / CCMP2709) TaxID=296587 RepID=C1EHI9_MICCC|nr:histone acetyltransferase [Micromonas commoda]ACO67513.1 histone acetyltransferase [Micromonas commoda]|eukprot:XP_002506255.1 histone acetyltransferase [Micromonas commoda]
MADDVAAPAPDAEMTDAPAPDGAGGEISTGGDHALNSAPNVGTGDGGAPLARAQPAASDATPPKPRVFKIGDKVSALASFDGVHHEATVVDLRRAKGAEGKDEDAIGPHDVSYYVRYAGMDKRLDAWVAGSNVDVLDPGMTRNLSDPLLGPGSLASPRKDSVNLGDGAPHTEGRKVTRNLKRRYNEINNVAGSIEDLAPIDQKLEKEHDEKTKVKNIGCVEFGRFEVDAWYFSPYPAEYADCSKLYVCEHCLKYMKHEVTLLKHKARCRMTHPPGRMIYRHPRHDEGKPGLAFWEIDGNTHKVYCQNLCLLAKLFLDHKTLYFDVDPFLFYVMTEFDERTNKHAVVGYFSKEKWSNEDYNLACILTLPPYQRKGYGSFLIAMSYEISRREGKVGTPERPLSDLGQVSYRSFWCREVLQVLHAHKGSISVKDISGVTGFQERDIASALQSLNLLKYWKGQHIISATPKIIEEHMRSFDSKRQIAVNQGWFNTQWQPPTFAPPPKPMRGGANRQ